MYLHIGVFSILFGYFLFCVTGCTVWTSSLTWHQEAWNESTPTVMWPHRHQTQHRWRHHTFTSNVYVSLIIWCDNNPRLQCSLVTRQQKGLAWFDKKRKYVWKRLVVVEELAGSGFRWYLLFLRLLTHSHPHLIFATHVCFLSGTITTCFKLIGRIYWSGTLMASR